MDQLPTKYADLGDLRLAYREHGQGPALILLHGNSESKAIFKDHQLKHFHDRHTFALDSRGHGQSISTDSAYSIPQYADDVIRFCRAMGIVEADVVGYSDGGNIALLLAKKAPQMFPRLVAISPNYLVSGTEEKTLKAFIFLANFLKFLRKLGFDTSKQLMRMDLMLTDIGISDAELAAIQTRLFIIYAEKDMIKEEHMLQIARLVPGALVRRIPDCTHMSIPHKAEAVEAMREFLA